MTHGLVARLLALVPKGLVSIQSLSLCRCVTLGKSLILNGPTNWEVGGWERNGQLDSLLGEIIL